MTDDIKFLWAWLLTTLFTVLLLIEGAMITYAIRHYIAVKAGLVEKQCFGTGMTMWSKP